MSFIIYSPLDQFEVNSLISLQISFMNYLNLAITNFGLYTIITLYIIIALHVIADNDDLIVPNK